MKMDIKELTLNQVDELKKIINCEEKNHFWQVGKNYLIRTVTHYLTGKLIAVGDKELVLESVAWIADTRRWSDCLKNGFANDAEIEAAPDGEVLVGRGALIDAYLWAHKLPRTTR